VTEEESIAAKTSSRKFDKKWLLLPVWVYLAFVLAQLLVVAIQFVLIWLGAPLNQINQALHVAIISLLAYVLAIVIVILVPLKLKKKVTTKKDLGTHNWPSWMDLALPIPAYIVYMILSGVLLTIIVKLFPDYIDLSQAQKLSISQSMLVTQIQYLLAFTTLVVLTPVAEEVLFRGYLYGKLRKTAPIWLAIVATSLTFGLGHLWVGPNHPLQWAVAIDTFALSIILCLLREYTGAIWASILLHATKNGIAFYLLFVNPQVIDQLRTATLLLIGGF